MRIRDRAKVNVPPCPVCGASIEVNWVDIRAPHDTRAEWIPGRMWCTGNEDHDIRPVKSAADEWAREQSRLTARQSHGLTPEFIEDSHPSALQVALTDLMRGFDAQLREQMLNRVGPLRVTVNIEAEAQ